MPTEAKAPKVEESKDSPQVAILKHNRDRLTEKLERLKDQEPVEGHDFENAKQRAQNGIKEIDAELKRLTK